MELTAFQIGYIVVESLIGLFAVIGNGFILYIFATEERLRKRRNYFLMSLAMADFLLAVVGIPTTIMVIILSILLSKNLVVFMLYIYLDLSWTSSQSNSMHVGVKFSPNDSIIVHLLHYCDIC